MTQIIDTSPDIFDVRAELLAKLMRRPDCDSPGFVFLELPHELADDGEDLNAHVINEQFEWADSEWTVAIYDTPWYAADPADIREYAAALIRASTHADLLNAEAGWAVRSPLVAEFMAAQLAAHQGEIRIVGTEVRSGVEYTLLAGSHTTPQESKKARTAIRASIEISASEAKETTLNTILDPKSHIDAIQIADLAKTFGAVVNTTEFALTPTDGYDDIFTDVTVYLGDTEEQASNVSRIDITTNEDGVWELSPYFGSDSEFSGDEFAAMIEKSKVALALTAALNGQVSE